MRERGKEKERERERERESEREYGSNSRTVWGCADPCATEHACVPGRDMQYVRERARQGREGERKRGREGERERRENKRVCERARVCESVRKSTHARESTCARSSSWACTPDLVAARHLKHIL